MRYKPGLYRGGPCNACRYFDGKYWYMWSIIKENEWTILWIDEKHIEKERCTLREISNLEFLVVHGVPPPIPRPTKEDIRFVRRSRKSVRKRYSKLREPWKKLR